MPNGMTKMAINSIHRNELWAGLTKELRYIMKRPSFESLPWPIGPVTAEHHASVRGFSWEHGENRVARELTVKPNAEEIERLLNDDME